MKLNSAKHFITIKRLFRFLHPEFGIAEKLTFSGCGKCQFSKNFVFGVQFFNDLPYMVRFRRFSKI